MVIACTALLSCRPVGNIASRLNSSNPSTSPPKSNPFPLKSTLFSKGLEEVTLKAGDLFDADFAEAITQIPAPSPNLKGKIVDVLEKGYKLGDKIIRFPKVVIGN